MEISIRTAKLLIFTLVAFAICRTHSAIDCQEYQNDGCFCSNSSVDSRHGGWEIDCPDKYRIVYATQAYASLECLKTTPYKRAMFTLLNITDTDFFKIISCPLPNSTLQEIFEGITLRKFKYEISDKNVTLKESLLSGLDQLEGLILKKANIVEIEENAFANVTKIKRLDLDDNMLSTLPEGVFSPLIELMNLQLAGNLFESLPEKLFENNTKLQNIYLYNNKLKEIPSGLFNGLEELKVLDLSNNRLNIITAGILLGAINLIHLNIKGNNIMKIESGVFNNTVNLIDLDLSDNPNITALPEDLLTNITKLTEFKANSCKLKFIPKGFFNNAKKLQTIKFYNNRISFLDEDVFSENEELKELDLKFNNLTELPTRLFAKSKKLQKLHLGQNGISTIPDGFFDNTLALVSLKLMENRLKVLHGSWFKRLELEELYVNRNDMNEIIGSQPFGSKKLKRLDLSYNNITEFPHNINWAFYPSLEDLNMKNNKIMYLEVPNLFGTEVNLDNNQITTVDIKEIEFLENYKLTNDGNFENGPVFSLVGNNFNCDCRMINFFHYLKHHSASRAVEFKYPEKYKCNEPLSLQNISLLELKSSKFVCKVKENCPTPCECQYRAKGRVTAMRCSNITEIPTVLPPNTTEVNLGGNELTSLDALQDPLWENITVLNLDNNNLTSDEWVLPPNLEVLSLKYNQLELLPESLLEYVTGKKKFNLYLGANPWFCDCSTLNFKDWLHENAKKIMDIDEIRCQNEIFQNNSNQFPLVIRLTDELCPSDNEIDNAKLISVSIVCVILALLLFIVSILYYRNKQTVTAYIYIHFYKVFLCFFNEEELDENKTFDAFISYSSADREIAMNLLDKLEKGDGPRFKLCIHERDWLAGNLISWNIVNSVQNSRKTILVLSKAFLESVWFQVEFHTAYYQMMEDRIDRLIVIVNGELPKKETLDKDLQFLLSTKTYLEWGERWFWEKLRFALPHHREGNPKLNNRALRQQPNKLLLKTFEQKLASLTVNGDAPDVKQQNSLNTIGMPRANLAFLEETDSKDKKKETRNLQNNNAIEIEIGQLPSPPTEEPNFGGRVNNGFIIPV